LLTDLGSLIGGIFALLAAAALYIIGRRQAKATVEAADIQATATRQAAQQQAATANAELDHLKAEKTEEDRRAREDLLAALDTETARIAMLAEMMRRVADREGNPAVARAGSYKISVGPVLHEGPGIPTLVHGKIRLAVIHLLASIEQLNALIDTKGLMLNELRTPELMEALDKIQTRNDELQGALGEYGRNRRIIVTAPRRCFEGQAGQIVELSRAGVAKIKPIGTGG
jgi:hypothetical protein